MEKKQTKKPRTHLYLDVNSKIMKSNIWDLQVFFEALNKISISKKVPVLFNKHKVRPWLTGMRL